MRLVELIRLALARLAVSRLRAALTMLGIIIGVASVIALVAVGQGATSGITSQLEALGTNLLTINPGATTTGLVRGAAGSATTLTTDDAAAIGQLEGVAALAPEARTQQVVVAGSQNTTTQIVGTTADYAHVRNFDLWQGSFLTSAAVQAGLRVAVLGATTADDLGLGASAVGSTISIDGLPFTVVGILQPKGGVGFVSQDDQILVPIATVEKYFTGSDSVRTIDVSVASADQMTDVTNAITAELRTRHELAAADADDFSITNQAQLLSTVGNVTAILTALLAGIASISLVVGGIGIMNIMLVSVRERTREIGIRKAIGARSSDILLQFLVEAMTLSIIGGLVGTALGILVSAGIDAVAGWPLVINPTTLVLAVGFSGAVGIIFGVWPARQAAVLDPIAALRYE
ncbi:MAG: FtsX-like permease family protein [Chloroflexi bacterium]|nr:MAG: FtsX-like permease family protein [Chloroflexota bacterium]